MIYNILVTGGCGFIGSNFINYLYDHLMLQFQLYGRLSNDRDQANFHIYNIDALYYCASKENIREDIRNSPRYTFIKGNITSFDLITHILDTYQINVVIHFAAQSHVDNSFENSLQYTQDNILGTHTLLEATRKFIQNGGDFHRFIHISTDEVYGESMLEDGENKKDEQSILCPTNPYAATKAGAELLAKAYYFSYKMPIIITRSNNVYGPNQYHEKVIPRFIKLLQEGEKVTIQGDGSNVRSFLHVNDVSSAIYLVLENGQVGEIYNIGGDDEDEFTVLQVARMLIGLIKGTSTDIECDEYITYVEDRPFNDKRYYISNDKVKSLGWSKTKNFVDGLKELI
jgi:dTDP-glucose 4,6-dehydratase